MALPQFHVYASNRMELLAERWLALTEKPLSHPFLAEIVIVQNQGMARWLTLRQAERRGIAMNVETPFLRRFICDVLKAVFPEENVAEQLSKLSRETFLWTLYRHLPEFVAEGKERFSELQMYFADGSMMKRFQMAEQLASVFDQYIIHRSDILSRWGKQTDDTWLSHLWQMLWKKLGSPKLLDEWQILLAREIEQTSVKLPERISIMGISSMPPLFLGFLNVISEKIPVHLFFLNPVGEDNFWGDLQSKRQNARRLLQNHATAGEYDLYSENPLLASLGRQGQDFFNLLLDNENKWEENFFSKPDGKTVLTQLQSDLFFISNRGGNDTEKWDAPDRGDDSVQVHSCHNPMREVEVLYDRVLHFFNKDKSLKPEDIIVMLPDVDKYAAYIHAVFSSPEQDNKRIPYALSDRTLTHESHIAEAFFVLFELANSRMTRSEMLDFVFREAVREKFGIKAEDLEKIRTFVDHAGIRWGKDGEHRSKLGFPDFEENSWLWGLRRLLFGYAMKNDNNAFYDGVVPIADLAIDGDLLGYLVNAVETVFETIHRLNIPKTLAEWHRALTWILQDCFEENDRNSGEFRKLRTLFSGLTAFFDASGDALIDVKSISRYLSHCIAEEDNSNAFMRNGITFCSMRPMRAIPAKIICILGLNYDAFPRSNLVPSFDKLRKKVRVGDRSQRQNDQYLFLESILSARQKLYFSYVGRSEKDNGSLPPSVLLTDLEDYLTVAWKNGSTRFWFYDEKLQAFHPDYFSDKTRLISYSEDNAAACNSLLLSEFSEKIFFDVNIPLSQEEQEAMRNISMDTLVSFFGNPTRAFLQKRLNIRLPEEIESGLDDERFEPTNLENYSNEKQLIEAHLSGKIDIAHATEGRHIAGDFAPGDAGQFYFSEIQEKAQVLEKKIADSLDGTELDVFSGVTEIDGSMISGSVEYSGEKLVFWFPVKEKAKYILRAWIYGLFAASCTDEDKSGRPFSEVSVVFQEKTVTLSLPDYPRAALEKYITIYKRGMTGLLPFFAESSYEYAEKCFKTERDEKKAREAAEKKFHASREYGGEYGDAYIAFAYPDGFDFDRDDFKTLACDIYHDILKA